jgi:hypothetical protein
MLAGAGAVVAIAAIGGAFLLAREPSSPVESQNISAPAAPVASRSPFDGVWTGSWCPRAYRDRKAFCAPRVLRVAGGRIELESGQPGQPGYSKLTGNVAADGTVEMSGTGIGGQGDGRGLPFSVDLRGRVQGELMTTSGKFQNGRDIEFNLTRSQR